ncbi:MAG: TIGR02996 domain-containing protein [Myxococcaceae bacterium]
MTETECFAAVLAAPDDDAPRLVFADLLTGHGDPRGEFIALQCRLAATPDDDARRALRIAENKLLAAHEAKWTADFFDVAKSTPFRKVKVVFHRGFLEEATLPIDALDDLEPLFQAAPLLRRLRFDSPGFTGQTHAPPTLAGRLSSPRLRNVRALDLRLPAGGDAVALELAQCPHLGGLHTLHLEATSWPIPDFPTPVFSGLPASHRLGPRGAAALAASAHLKGLRDVKLASNALGAAGVKALLDGGWPLESLDVSGNQLDDSALVAIASAPSLSKLRHLGVGGGQYSAAALTAMATSKTLTSLVSLDLSFSQLAPRALEQFLAALKLPTLTELTLIATGLGDAGAVTLANSATSRQLTSLELGDNKVTQAGVFALADSSNLTGLKRLQLNDAWLGKKAVVEYLAASPHLAGCRIYVKGSLLGRSTKKPTEKKAAPKTAAKSKKAATPKKAR